MALLIIAMLAVVALGVVVVALVAVPAHRDGRDLLSEGSDAAVRSAQQRLSARLRERLPRTHWSSR